MEPESDKPKRGQMSMREAQRRGGRATAEKMTHDERWDRASAGGREAVERHGTEHLVELGRRGGEETKRRHDDDYYRTRKKTGKPTRLQELTAQALDERDQERAQAKEEKEPGTDA